MNILQKRKEFLRKIGSQLDLVHAFKILTKKQHLNTKSSRAKKSDQKGNGGTKQRKD